MTNNQQKRKLTEYIDGIYSVMRQDKFTSTSLYDFRRKWQMSTHNKGLSVIGIDILYSIVMQKNDRILGFRDRIRVDFSGDIHAFLNADQYIIGKSIKRVSGFAGFSWFMLEKLQQNDMAFFSALYKQITQEKKIRKKIRKKLDI
jgi:hypothetical protein